LSFVISIALNLDQLARRQPGGITTYVRGLISGLSEVSPENRILGFGPRSELGGEQLDSYRAIHLPLPVLTRLWSQSDLGLPSADIAHATSLAGPLGKKKFALRSIFVHDLLWRDYPEFFTPRGVRFHEAKYQKLRSLGQVQVLVGTTALADRLAQDGFPRDHIHLSRLGINTKVNVDHEAAAELLSRVGVPTEFFLTVGTREPRKNLERLAAAKRSRPDLPPLVMVGPDGWGSTDSTGLIGLGPQSAGVLAALGERATAHVFVPIAEGWGLPAVEALAAGRPLLASSSVPSVQNRADVILTDPLDVDAMADALERVLALPDSTVERRMRQHSVADLTWANCANDHLAVWSQVSPH